MTRIRRAVVLASIVAVALVGCAGGPDPRDEAQRLAADLADGTFDTATTSNADQADEDLAAALGTMAAVPREVTVGEVGSGTDSATRVAQLTWTWDLGEEATPWTVETTAELRLVEGAWVTQWSPSIVHPDAVEGSALRLVRTDAARGDVVGAEGEVIATNRPVYRIGLDKSRLADAETARAAGADLATRLEFDDPAAFGERVASAGASAFVVAITVRQDEAERWNVDELRTLPGVLVQPAELPLAPTSTFARAVLGTVGEATAEIVEASDGAISPGAQVGLSGLQRLYDVELRGTPASTVRLVTGETSEDLHASPAVDGTDLAVTLDVGLQTQAEAILADVPTASAIVAVRPSDGHVLAAASGAGSDGLNTAMVGLFPPGSTFKVATALALLRAGLSPDSPVECSATTAVDGRAFENYPGYPASSLGQITLREAVAQSCNTAFISQHGTIDAADVATAAETLGIGTTGTWPFSYASGSVPADATGTQHAAGLIGQGQVLASPLAMAVAAASVAQGATVTPVLLPAKDAEVDSPQLPLSDDEAAGLREMMREVVLSGTSTFLADVPGDPVHAKSGTAQHGTDDPPATHAWMIAFQGDLAVAVFVADGGAGASTAGPLLEEFLRAAG